MRKLLVISMMSVAAAVVMAPVAVAADGGQGSAAQSQSAKTSNLTAAREKITDVIKNPKLMAEVMKTLSAADQCTFLGEVNKAIAKMSGSNEEKAAIFLNVNRSALDGAAKGNAAAIVAETFATVPVGVLTVINEVYASDVFNRAADPKKTYTDEQFVKIATDVMKVIVARLSTVPDSDVRGGFAALTLIRASNSESTAIQEAIIATLPSSVQKTATKEWFPSALATGNAQSYEPMLGMIEGDASRPVRELCLRLAGPQETDAMLSDLSGANTDPLLTPNQAQPVIDSVYSPIRHDFSNIGVGDAASATAAQVGTVRKVVEEEKKGNVTESEPEPEPGPEPKPYQWQTTK